jgi:hypothetical protein
MIKGQDILILLKLFGEDDRWTVRSVGEPLGMDPAGVHRALQRLEQAGLLDATNHRVNRSNAEEFLVHGLKYLFPARQEGLTRGVPTAWAAPPLSDELVQVDEPPPVWPDAHGEVRGVALQPIHENAVAVARRDPVLAEKLALLDALRLGDGRVRSLAAKRLRERLHPTWAAP